MSIAMGDRFDDIRAGLDQRGSRSRPIGGPAKRTTAQPAALIVLAGVSAGLAPIASVMISALLGAGLVLAATLAAGWPSNFRIGFSRPALLTLLSIPIVVSAASWMLASNVDSGLRAAALGLGAILGVTAVATAIVARTEDGWTTERRRDPSGTGGA